MCLIARWSADPDPREIDEPYMRDIADRNSRGTVEVTVKTGLDDAEVRATIPIVGEACGSDPVASEGRLNKSDMSVNFEDPNSAGTPTSELVSFQMASVPAKATRFQVKAPRSLSFLEAF